MSDNVLSLKNVAKNTGFLLRKIETESKIPYFEIVNENIDILYQYKDIIKIEESAECRFDDIPTGNMIAAAAMKRENGGKNIMFATPSFTSKLFRKIAEESGCTHIAPYNTTVYADSRFLGIFAHSDISTDIELKDVYYDVIQHTTVKDTIHINMKKGDFLFLLKK